MLHIALGVDANYIKYAGVLMTNLVHQHIGRQLCLHLAVAGVTEEEKEQLRAALETAVTLLNKVQDAGQ